MSRTYRKNKYGKVLRDGQDHYKCKCDYCMGVKKKKAEKKQRDKEVKEALINLEM